MAGQHRANRWGCIADYAQTASEQICVLVQIESADGVKFFDSIIAVDGVDGAFIGPNDMAASMGFLGQQHHPEVQRAIQTLPGIAARGTERSTTTAFGSMPSGSFSPPVPVMYTIPAETPPSD